MHIQREECLSGRTGVDREVYPRVYVTRILMRGLVRFESKASACNVTIDGKSSLRACETESPAIIEKQQRTPDARCTCTAIVCELENEWRVDGIPAHRYPTVRSVLAARNRIFYKEL